jgi:hypothetical protein
MIRKSLAVVAYITLFLLAVVLFSYFLFPLDRLREFVERKANTSTKYRLEIDSLERDGLGRLVLSGVNVGVNRKLFRRKGAEPAGTAVGPAGAVQPPAGVVGGPAAAPEAGGPPEGTDGEPEEPAAAEAAEQADEREGTERDTGEFSYVLVDQVTVDFSLAQLLNPTDVTLGVEMDLLGGTIRGGEIEIMSEEGRTMAAVRLPAIEGLQLGETEFFASIFSAILPSLRTDHVNGSLQSGSVVLEPAREEELTYYKGQVDLDLSDIVAEAPVLAQRMPRTAQVVEVPLTDMRLGRCVFEIRIDRKEQIEELDKIKARKEGSTAILFERGDCKGESLDYYIRPNSFILFPPKAPFVKGQMDLWTKLAFNPDYFDEEKKGPDGKAVTRNKELGQGLQFDRLWQTAQDADGFYWMHCTGTLSKPKCKRGLPPDEKRRLQAKKEMEKQRKADEAKARAGTEPPGAASSAGGSDSEAVLIPSAPPESPSAKRLREARERAERLRAEREARRDRPSITDRPAAMTEPLPVQPLEPTDRGEEAPVEGPGEAPQDDPSMEAAPEEQPAEYPPTGEEAPPSEGGEYGQPSEAPPVDDGSQPSGYQPDVIQQPDAGHDAGVVGGEEQPGMLAPPMYR